MLGFCHLAPLAEHHQRQLSAKSELFRLNMRLTIGANMSGYEKDFFAIDGLTEWLALMEFIAVGMGGDILYWTYP